MITLALNGLNLMIRNGAYWMFLMISVLSILLILLILPGPVEVILTVVLAGTGNTLKQNRVFQARRSQFCLTVCIATAKYGSTDIIWAFGHMVILLFITTSH